MSMWILASARSGSTFLAHVISHLINQPIREEFSSAFSYRTVQDFQNSPCQYGKILHIQFNRIFYPHSRFDPDPSVVPDRHLIRPQPCDRKIVEQSVSPLYIKLTRNPIDQALSYYMTTMARDDASYFYIDSAAKQNKLRNKDIPKDAEKARKMYKAVSHFPRIWDDYLGDSEHVCLDYDSLSSERLAEVLGKKKSDVIKTIDLVDQKLFRASSSHPSYHSYKEWFINSIDDLL